MRKLWTYETKLDWDDPIPEEYGKEWMTFFDDLPEMEKITVKRCLKPHNAIAVSYTHLTLPTKRIV